MIRHTSWNPTRWLRAFNVHKIIQIHGHLFPNVHATELVVFSVCNDLFVCHLKVLWSLVPDSLAIVWRDLYSKSRLSLKGLISRHWFYFPGDFLGISKWPSFLCLCTNFIKDMWFTSSENLVCPNIRQQHLSSEFHSDVQIPQRR